MSVMRRATTCGNRIGGNASTSGGRMTQQLPPELEEAVATLRQQMEKHAHLLPDETHEMALDAITTAIRQMLDAPSGIPREVAVAGAAAELGALIHGLDSERVSGERRAWLLRAGWWIRKAQTIVGPGYQHALVLVAGALEQLAERV